MDKQSEEYQILQKIKLLDKKLKNLYAKTRESYGKERIELHSKHDELIDEIFSLEDELFWRQVPIKTNGVIELRKEVDYIHFDFEDNNDLTGDYLICLASEKRVIGNLEYRGYHFSEFYGDIGGRLDKEYRGNNYWYIALNLFFEFLKDNNVSDVWISAYDDNIPSVKTIAKCGGIPIKNEKYYRLYDINLIEEKNKTM